MNKNRLMCKYSILQGSYWMLFCAVYAFSTVFLMDRGFDGTQVGLIVALGNILGVILQPSVASVADRSQRFPVHRLTATLAAAALAVLALLYVLPDSRIFVALLFILADALLQTLQPLINSVSVYYINRGIDMNFGVARGIGSVSYAVGASLFGALIAALQSSKVVLAAGVLLLAVIITVVRWMPLLPANAGQRGENAGQAKDRQMRGNAGQAGEGQARGNAGQADDRQARRNTGRTDDRQMRAEKPAQTDGGAPGFLARYRWFSVVLVGLTLLLMNHNMQNNYLIQIVTPLGGDSASMGNALAIAAALELPTMFVFSRLVKKFSSSRLLTVSGFFFFLKAAGYFLAGNMTQMYLAQIFQMGAFALYIPASVYYVNKVMTEQDKFKGQALMVGTSTLGGVFGSLAGGAIVDHLNVRCLTALGLALTFTGMVLVAAAAPRVKRVV